MYELIIIRYGEITLKGDNMQVFIGQLIKNIDQAVTELGDFEITTVYGRIFLHAEAEYIEEIVGRLKKVPGIVSLSPAHRFRIDKKLKDFDDENLQQLKKRAALLFEEEVDNYPATFKVETQRSDKSFPIQSPKISSILGAAVLKNSERKELKLSVDVHNPQHLLEVEIRRGKIYLFIRREKGPGGLPVNTAGKALLLLSGGIDSPAAGWFALKRGMQIEAVYFHSPPYTCDKAKEKVLDIAEVLSDSAGEIKLFIPYFTEIQRQIVDKCPENYIITILRRMMARTAEKIAEKRGHKTLITGENLGQVASQTIEGISSTDDAVKMTILRPLITMDKQEIIAEARKIGTYDISIRPYQDCCTIVVPDEPVTKPPLDKVREIEAELNIEALIENSLAKMEVEHIS